MSKKSQVKPRTIEQPKLPQRILAPEQLRYCQILAEHGEMDATALSSVYATVRGEPEDYFKTYSHLRRMTKSHITERREIERHTPPYAALRKVALWSLTKYGRDLVTASVDHYRKEYEKLQREPFKGK